MIFPKAYKVLKRNIFEEGDFKIIPIRYEDKLDILKWRNEQMYHLRQSIQLTITDQEKYFKNVVSKLFTEEQPNQILFSYIENDKLVGYGGLVHIDWVDKHAELSFVMNTELEEFSFEYHWETYLKLIEKVAFKDLNLHKISTYAFDLRPRLYPAIEKVGFKKEAVLKEHCIFNEKYIDVIIHFKLNK